MGASTGQVYEPAGDAFYMLSEPSVAVSEDKTECYVSFSARAGASWRGILLAKVPADADGNEDVALTTVADTSTPIPAGNTSVKSRVSHFCTLVLEPKHTAMVWLQHTWSS